MESDTIRIYDSSNIEILLPEKVEKDLFLSELRHSDIKEMQKIVFSQDEEILFLATNLKILAFNVKDGNPNWKISIDIPFGYGKALFLRWNREASHYGGSKRRNDNHFSMQQDWVQDSRYYKCLSECFFQ